MNTVKGIICRIADNGTKLIQTTAIKDFKMELSGDREWYLGIDPATKFTGIALLDVNKEFVILMDFWRDKLIPKEDYEQELYYALRRLVHNKTVKYVVVEKPFNSKYARTSVELISLQGKVKTWLKMIPELNAAPSYFIPVPTWKSYIIDKSKGKGRFNANGAVADDLCDVFPGLVKYRFGLNKGDLDSYDALGILLGGLLHNFTTDGQTKIAGEKELSHKTFIGYLWVDETEISDAMTACMNKFKNVLGQPKVLQFNERYDVLDNYTIASTENDFAVTIIPDKYLQQFQWKLGIDISEPNKVLLAFIVRKGHMSVSNMRVLSEYFTLQEEVNGKD